MCIRIHLTSKVFYGTNCLIIHPHSFSYCWSNFPFPLAPQVSKWQGFQNVDNRNIKLLPLKPRHNFWQCSHSKVLANWWITAQTCKFFSEQALLGMKMMKWSTRLLLLPSTFRQVAYEETWTIAHAVTLNNPKRNSETSRDLLLIAPKCATKGTGTQHAAKQNCQPLPTLLSLS